MKNQIIIILSYLLSLSISISGQDFLENDSTVPENLKKIVNTKFSKTKPTEFGWYKLDTGYGGTTSFFEGKGLLNTEVTFLISNKGKFEAEYKIYDHAYSKYIPEKITKKAIEECTKLEGSKPDPLYAMVKVDDNSKFSSYTLYYGNPNNACVADFNASGKMIGKAKYMGATEM